MKTYHSRKLVLAALISIAFSIINNDAPAQGKIGSIEIFHKGKGFANPCNMYVYISKIRLEPGVKYEYITWPPYRLAGTIQEGESLRLYVNENERMQVRVSTSDVGNYFWGWGVLHPGMSYRFELFCK